MSNKTVNGYKNLLSSTTRHRNKDCTFTIIHSHSYLKENDYENYIIMQKNQSKRKGEHYKYMTETSHRIQDYKIDHSTFGGIIQSSDYCTNYPRHSNTRSIASRIASDQNFDEQCRRNAKNRDKMEHNKESKQNKEN